MTGPELPRVALDSEWYQRPVIEVAPGLLGAFITATSADGAVTARITEVEAYGGADDPASHAFRGRTARNAAMFGPPGHLYVYRHLGLHHCLNLVCEPDGAPAAVLLRAAEVVEGTDLARERRRAGGVVRSDRDLAAGPARLAVALGLDLTADGEDVTGTDGRVVVHRGGAVSPADVERGPRIGVRGPGADPERFPWRWRAASAAVGR